MFMARLIDANEIEELFYKQVEYGATDLMDAFDDALQDAQTVDALEVVRCKDCIHWYETEGVCLKIYSDGAVSPYAWQDRNPDDYCSYGERKDND
jgi:hypothetical protein